MSTGNGKGCLNNLYLPQTGSFSFGKTNNVWT
jgi:hypothetical protein